MMLESGAPDYLYVGDWTKTFVSVTLGWDSGKAEYMMHMSHVAGTDSGNM